MSVAHSDGKVASAEPGPQTGGEITEEDDVFKPLSATDDNTTTATKRSDQKQVTNTADIPDGVVRQPTSSSLWSRVRQLWKKHGVVEVDPSHRRYDILCCIKEAIKDLILNHPELGPKDSIAPEDFHHVLEQTVTGPGGKKFRFKSYASGVFATLRHAIGLDEHSYMQSLAPGNLPYMEFVSNSKGGRDFFLTNDKAYFMKTEKKYYVKVFLDLLDDYLNHFLKHPHSLIVKYLGLYSIKIPGEGQMYFYVMQSIYHPDDRINIRYDVKGCLAGRYQEPPEEGSEVMTVLKDENFVENKEQINLGPQRGWFLEQLALDIAFMKRLRVQDYSLLVAYYPLQQDERKQDFGDVALRIKKSVLAGRKTSSSTEQEKSFSHSEGDPAGGEGDTWSAAASTTTTRTQGDIELTEVSNGRPALSALPEVNPTTDDGLDDNEQDDADLLDFKPDKDVIRDVNLKLKMSFVDADYLDMTEAENRRLLPNTKNALHIIDGPHTRYHMGLIDFFTLYECRQRVGRVLKSIKFGCRDHSTIPPSAYGDRMYNFIADHTV